MSDKKDLLFHVHKIFFDCDFSCNDDKEHFKTVLMHWQLCTKRNKCNFKKCNELTEIIKHYEQCIDECCIKCCPTRWLVVKWKLDQVRAVVN
jgi:TAZ zinc finger